MSRLAKVRGRFIEHIDKDVLYERDHGRCGICGERVGRRNLTVDHIRPASRNGTHEYSNVQIAHEWCNSMKGNSLHFSLKLVTGKKRKLNYRNVPKRKRKPHPAS